MSTGVHFFLPKKDNKHHLYVQERRAGGSELKADTCKGVVAKSSVGCFQKY